MALGVKVPILSEFNSKGFKAAYAEFKKLENTSQRIAFLSKKAFSPAGLTAMAGAATTAAYAIWDMAKAAGADEQSQKILAQALENTTGATDEQIASVESLITSLQMASGIADTELRTGFQNLARATGDVTKSSELLKLAMDVSIGTGKDLGSVTTALGKAYLGNVSSLKRLGVPLSEATVKSNDFAGAVREMVNTFGGTALTNADTFSGKVQIMTERMNEAKETLGRAFIPLIMVLTDVIKPAVDGLGKLGAAFGWVNMQAGKSKWWKALLENVPVLGTRLKNTAINVGDLNSAMEETDLLAGNAADGIQQLLNILSAKPVEAWRVSAGLADLNDYLQSLGYETEVVAQKISTGGGSFKNAIEEATPPLVRYAQALKETQAQLAGTLTGFLDLSTAAQGKGVSGFVQGVMGQASQIKNLAKNLTTLGERGLNPAAIQGIMSLDLGTAASLAQDLVNSAFSGRMIKNLNRAYGTISTAATQFGQSMGGFMMTGGVAPVTQHITITNPNPKAVVQQLREYGRNAGPLPLAVTGSF